MPVSFYWDTQKKAVTRVWILDGSPKDTAKYLPEQGPEKLNQAVIFSFKTQQREDNDSLPSSYRDIALTQDTGIYVQFSFLPRAIQNHLSLFLGNISLSSNNKF